MNYFYGIFFPEFFKKYHRKLSTWLKFLSLLYYIRIGEGMLGFQF
jgi:hypothetical protein